MAVRTAVLVDGDNVSGAHGATILKAARAKGVPDVVRVYADAQRNSGWHDAVGYRLIHAGTGKNAADLLLSIDAMELALVGGIGTFFIASSDKDFTHLAHRLREYGKSVNGFGEAKTPEAFRSACCTFVEIGSSAMPKEPAVPVSEFDRKIRAMIAANSKKGTGMQISQLSGRMFAQHGTRISTYPEGNWRAYLLARPQLYDLDPRGPEAKVRFRPQGFGNAA
ncbi:NYN domain-containing protein [Rhodovulum adriaticum]|uniref:NYN domain-containing protein n=1 Tax=Rhodovulum adriaticum TaxID=35804 RepID=A0A4R2NIX7_RHOAD|nr:NYN domain-containing protein [Rhodovulum adriaticum]MBK1634624.1 NYN domain-containing protein [Rhodovulum adriaticum]TCP21252.1 NYN domain-containing protein [Rhodovulum adriaticum]